MKTVPMRRDDRIMSEAETRKFLENGEIGFLATADEKGQPYVIGMNYGVIDNTIYLHAALTGHKVDNIKSNPRACFTVVDQVQIVPERINTYYYSVVAFGPARLLYSGEEKETALMDMVRKYSPMHDDCFASHDVTLVIALDIEHLSGKKNPLPPEMAQ